LTRRAWISGYCMHDVLAMDIGGSHFRVGLFDHAGRRLEVLEGDTSRSGGRDWMLDRLRGQSQELLKRADGPVKACGISFGGPVDFERQQVRSLHVSGWEDFPLAQWARETLNLPCRLDNDANAGALGEYRFGAGRNTRSMFYVTLSTGIGGGLVLDGRVHHGRDSLAGEIGHIPVSDSGVLCACGAQGCLETFCSGTAIALRGREWANRRPEGAARVLQLSGGRAESISAQAVAEAAAAGDSMAVSIIHESAHWLARALLMVVRILNPDKIILGGGVALAGEVLLEPLRQSMQDLASPALPFSIEVVLAELGNYSPLYGGAAMVMELVAGADASTV
jgi:glucokinase